MSEEAEGFFSALTAEQREAALRYSGPDNYGPAKCSECGGKRSSSSARLCAKCYGAGKGRRAKQSRPMTVEQWIQFIMASVYERGRRDGEQAVFDRMQKRTVFPDDDSGALCGEWKSVRTFRGYPAPQRHSRD